MKHLCLSLLIVATVSWVQPTAAQHDTVRPLLEGFLGKWVGFVRCTNYGRKGDAQLNMTLHTIEGRSVAGEVSWIGHNKGEAEARLILGDDVEAYPVTAILFVHEKIVRAERTFDTQSKAEGVMNAVGKNTDKCTFTLSKIGG